MSPVMIAVLVVGALLPVVVGVAIVVLWTPRGTGAGWSMPLAFGKGVVLGIALGAAVSLIVVALVLAGAWWLRR
jgi:hypothetical protein